MIVPPFHDSIEIPLKVSSPFLTPLIFRPPPVYFYKALPARVGAGTSLAISRPWTVSELTDRGGEAFITAIIYTYILSAHSYPYLPFPRLLLAAPSSSLLAGSPVRARFCFLLFRVACSQSDLGRTNLVAAFRVGSVACAKTVKIWMLSW